MIDITSVKIHASIPSRLTDAGITFHAIVVDGALRYLINGTEYTPGQAVDTFLN